MHLTKFSDYAMRVLMLAAARGDHRLTNEQTAATFDVSQSHLKKVVLTLTRAGYLHGIRGAAAATPLPASRKTSISASFCG